MAKKAKDDAEGKKKPLVPIVLVIVGLVVGVGVSKTVLASPAKPAAAGAEGTTPVTKKPGEIATIESMNVNLQGSHYLRVGVGVQLAVGPVGEEWAKAEGAKVRDEVIAVFSGRPMEELDTTEGREAALAELTTRLTEEPAEGEPENVVIDVYLTDFVMR